MFAALHAASAKEVASLAQNTNCSALTPKTCLGPNGSPTTPDATGGPRATINGFTSLPKFWLAWSSESHQQRPPSASKIRFCLYVGLPIGLRAINRSMEIPERRRTD